MKTPEETLASLNNYAEPLIVALESLSDDLDKLCEQLRTPQNLHKWEYMRVHDERERDIMPTLNVLGDKGWEIFFVEEKGKASLFYLKRPK